MMALSASRRSRLDSERVDLEELTLECTPHIDFTAAEEGEGVRLPRFVLNGYTGGRMRPRGFYGDVIVDLAGVRVQGGSRPILFDHDPSKIVGHTDSIEIDTSIRATGVISGAGESAREVVASAKNGFPWRASIGATIEKAAFVEDGEKVDVNGKTFVGPVTVIRRAALGEISFVSLAADNATSVKVAAASNKEGDSMSFTEWLEANGFDAGDLTDQQKVVLTASWKSTQKEHSEGEPEPPILEANGEGDTIAASQGEDTIEKMRQRTADELSRQAKIEKIFAGKNPDLQAKAIAEGWDETKAELEFMKAQRDVAPAVHSKEKAAEMPKAIECSFAMRNGVNADWLAKQPDYCDRDIEAALSKDIRGYGLQTLMYDTVRAAGRYVRPGQVDDNFIRETLLADRQLQAGEGFSSFSLSGVLSNTANKMLLSSFEAVPMAIATRVAEEVDAPDFKQFFSYRVTLNGLLLELGPDGEIKSTEMVESEFSNQLKTYARRISLTRVDMTNDDLGAFLRIPRLFGRSARLTLERTFWTLVLSNPGSFFSTANGNYFEGAATNLQISSLTTGEQLFLDQTDADGHPVLLAPAFLVVGTALKVIAQQLMTETRIIQEGVTNTAKSIPANNPHAGKWEPLATPYINSQGLSGESATQWYLIANPADVPFAQIGYLRGRRSPTIESSEADFDTLGMKWRTYFDFGVALQEHRAAVKSKGAA